MNPLAKNIAGRKWGNLTALYHVENTANYRKRWMFRCDCGNEKVITLHDVRNGAIKTCGCSKKKPRGPRKPKETEVYVARSAPKFRNGVPSCVDKSGYEEWVTASNAPILKQPVCGFCEDCMPEFKAKMQVQGRCENQTVYFVTDYKNGTRGVLRA